MPKYKLEAFNGEWHCAVSIIVNASTELEAIAKAKKLVRRDSYVVRDVIEKRREL